MTEQDYKYRKSQLYIPMFFMFLLGIWFIYNSFKTEKSVENITGIIIDKGVRKEQYKGNNFRYTFYFRVDNNKEFFGIFLGSGDNSIKEGDYYNNIIEIGQPITVYYDNNIITNSENITRLIYRLDYKGKTIIKTNQNKRFLAGLISISIGLLLVGILQWINRKHLNKLEVSRIDKT